MSHSTIRTSAEETLERFDTPAAAAKYAASLGGTATHRREMRCILRLLHGLPTGATVLDLPCGTGRLLPELARSGFEVTEADSSPHMVALARDFAAANGLPLESDRFVVASVFESGFADNAFDAVVCNRLLHHFREDSVRQKALRELSRICKGPIVVSFFCNRSIDAAVFHVKQALAREKAADRIPVPVRVFAQDVHEAGLIVRRWMPSRQFISKQWYALLARADSRD